MLISPESIKFNPTQVTASNYWELESRNKEIGSTNGKRCTEKMIQFVWVLNVNAYFFIFLIEVIKKSPCELTQFRCHFPKRLEIVMTKIEALKQHCIELLTFNICLSH